MESIDSIIQANIYGDNEEAFFVLNFEDIILKHKKWLELLPRVVPFYAVKCNNIPVILEMLVGLGLSFDCSSRAEVEAVLSCGVEPKNIIFANACKSNDFIRYSKSVGVDVFTFDNEDELVKTSELFASARLVLRIKADDSHSTSKLGLKFGAEVEQFETLLNKAKSLGLNVVGVSFHVGSGCQSTDPYLDAIQKARHAFDIGIRLGFDMNLLDIGGGFPGSDRRTKLSFETIAKSVNTNLDKYFAETVNKLTIIAEPGRYYAMSSMDLCVLITSKRVGYLEDKKFCMYYINDGLYGSFSSVITGNKIVDPISLLRNDKDLDSRDNCSAVIWGPTCDSYDCVRKDFSMPEMNVGEWLRFKDMGSYSRVAASTFNGMPLAKIKIFTSKYAKNILTQLNNWPKIEKLMKEYPH